MAIFPGKTKGRAPGIILPLPSPLEFFALVCTPRQVKGVAAVICLWLFDHYEITGNAHVVAP